MQRYLSLTEIQRNLRWHMACSCILAARCAAIRMHKCAYDMLLMLRCDHTVYFCWISCDFAQPYSSKWVSMFVLKTHTCPALTIKSGFAPGPYFQAWCARPGRPACTMALLATLIVPNDVLTHCHIGACSPAAVAAAPCGFKDTLDTLTPGCWAWELLLA